ncbi:hypothetical protein PLESTM_000417300 [Pleodorina starrii]|nr:hypothetical protein PLESTM_000417300 [Pleodorina starrii]
MDTSSVAAAVATAALAAAVATAAPPPQPLSSPPPADLLRRWELLSAAQRPRRLATTTTTVGCYEFYAKMKLFDISANPIMSLASTTSTTVESCAATAQGLGYRYIGLRVNDSYCYGSATGVQSSWTASSCLAGSSNLQVYAIVIPTAEMLYSMPCPHVSRSTAITASTVTPTKPSAAEPFPAFAAS